MDKVKNMWNRWKKRTQSSVQSRTQDGHLDRRTDRTSNPSMSLLRPSDFRVEFKSSRQNEPIIPTLNDDDVTVGKVDKNSSGIKKFHSFQIPDRSSSVSRMVQEHQTSTLEGLDKRGKVEETCPSQASRSRSLDNAQSSKNYRQQQSPVSHPVPHDGVSTRQLLMNLLKTGSEKLSFTQQAMELLREFVWILEMFPNHVHLGEELQVNRWANRQMTPPPQPRINVFAQPALVAKIKTDAHGNWLINSETLGCLLYFLYRQECKPMLDEMNHEREELERMRQARQVHVEQLKVADKFSSLKLK